MKLTETQLNAFNDLACTCNPTTYPAGNAIVGRDLTFKTARQLEALGFVCTNESPRGGYGVWVPGPIRCWLTEAGIAFQNNPPTPYIGRVVGTVI